jgi:hypothetical protein
LSGTVLGTVQRSGYDGEGVDVVETGADVPACSEDAGAGWVDGVLAGLFGDGPSAGDPAGEPDVGLALGLALLLGAVLALLPALGAAEGLALALPFGLALGLGVKPLGEEGPGSTRRVGPPARVTTAADGGTAICAVQSPTGAR